MRATTLLLLLVFALGAIAQQSGTSPDTGSKVDPALHTDVLTLLDLEGVREQMQASVPGSLETGRKYMMEKCGTGCSPEFGDEWVKRMKVRMNADDLVQVVVHAYEKNFTDADVKQLIPIAKAKKDGQTPVIPDDLKKRLATVFPELQSEVMAGCTQIGTKLGADVGTQLQKEHPEWIHQSTPAAK
jgi:hypothetical protein